jgi:predicted enzyme related to lactoylglutathione lyase
VSLIEFPADEPDRARRFWQGVLELELRSRAADEGTGWQASVGPEALIGLHARGPGPGDRVGLPYFAVENLPGALERVQELGGEIVHPGERWAVCRDSEGNPFGLAAS